MIAMRVFGVIAYTGLGALGGGLEWFGFGPRSSSPSISIALGAVIGLLYGIYSWIRAVRD